MAAVPAATAFRKAHAQIKLQAVQPERPDPDQHMAGRRYRDRELADGQGGLRSRSIQDDREHGSCPRGRAREEDAAAGRRPSGSGTHNPHLSILIDDSHSCSFVGERWLLASASS
jgi:hypothetical protein